MTFDKTKYNLQYAKEKLKRVPLDLTKEKYQDVKNAADRSGSSVNGYIKAAIDEKLDREFYVYNCGGAQIPDPQLPDPEE